MQRCSDGVGSARAAATARPSRERVVVKGEVRATAATVAPSSAHAADCTELFRWMVFKAAVTNNDEHPRNHALLRTQKGWRLSPAYDVAPAPVVSLERRDLADRRLLTDCPSRG
ncbi:HipA domain-containing protein [Variovorax sp. LT1R16]|uniref:HipA domain-containing protein n=1 Tax=Variovorax sp. LT1R16 TaxID=3443728 RepID=UPI003F448461